MAISTVGAFSGFAVRDIEEARAFYGKILAFTVSDERGALDVAVAELEAEGVTLLRYDGMQQDEKGIARDPNGPKIAWFTDPSGNILAVLQTD